MQFCIIKNRQCISALSRLERIEVNKLTSYENVIPEQFQSFSLTPVSAIQIEKHPKQ